MPDTPPLDLDCDGRYAPATMPHRLLLADDSVTIQRVIELTFAEEDVRVTAVGDGQQAIDSIREEPPDIVLSDIAMPVCDGYTVAAFIKDDPKLAHIPVVLLTGAYEPVDEARAKAIGCDGVMVKPFEPQMVINRVRELLAGKRPAALWTASLDQQDGVGIYTAGQDQVLAPAAAAAPVDGTETPEVEAPPAEATDAAEASSTSRESVDHYFDRLNDALDTLEDPSPLPPALEGDAPPLEGPVASELSPPLEELMGSVEPVEATGGPSDEATSSVEAQPPEPGIAAPATPTQPMIPDPPPAATLSLAEMFSALLAAEQSWPSPPDTPGGQAASVLATERLVADVTRRVLAQVTDRVVQDAVSREVTEVAERLVREEIERIKAMADAEQGVSHST